MVEPQDAAVLAPTTHGTCGLLEEYAVRVCSMSRAHRTCNVTWIILPAVQARCTWLERCMRCVPPPEALRGVATCAVDGVIFGSDGSCPLPSDVRTCADCNLIVMQEVCLGICSQRCAWANVSWMRGEYCSLRDPPVEADDNLFMVMGLAAIGIAVLALVCLGLRFAHKARKGALEAQRAEMRQWASNYRQAGAFQNPALVAHHAHERTNEEDSGDEVERRWTDESEVSLPKARAKSIRRRPKMLADKRGWASPKSVSAAAPQDTQTQPTEASSQLDPSDLSEGAKSKSSDSSTPSADD